MGNINRTLALILIAITAISCFSLLSVKPANAQTIPKPATPEFTAKLVSLYTTINTDGTINNVAMLELSVTSQHYSYNGSTLSVFYNVRVREPSDGKWVEIYSPVTYASGAEGYNANPIYPQSGINYTMEIPADNFTTNGPLDVQVRATLCLDEVHVNFSTTEMWHHTLTYGPSSDWSNTWTVTLSASSPSPSPTVPELPWLVIVPLLLSVFAVAVVVKHRKTANCAK